MGVANTSREPQLVGGRQCGLEERGVGLRVLRRGIRGLQAFRYPGPNGRETLLDLYMIGQ